MLACSRWVSQGIFLFYLLGEGTTSLCGSYPSPLAIDGLAEGMQVSMT